ncbi:hypothetical protein KUCAC02_024493, partial [Chaenocephalus aceratus]
VSQDALPAECIELAALMNSVVLGVRGQRLGVLQLASRAAVDSTSLMAIFHTDTQISFSDYTKVNLIALRLLLLLVLLPSSASAVIRAIVAGKLSRALPVEPDIQAYRKTRSLWFNQPLVGRDPRLSIGLSSVSVTPLRFSLIVCISLIFGVTAKPYKPWNKLPDEAFQDTVMSLDGEGKMSWRVEVEPPEDMDETDYDIDPEMKIWKSMTGGQEEQPLKAEEDLDELYHPSVVDLLKEPEEDKDDVDHPGFGEAAPNEPEQDWDEVYHRASEELAGYLASLVAGNKPVAEIRVSHSEPEKDELYHHHDQGSAAQKELLSHEVAGESEVRVHFQPEEDMDDLYHKDLLKLIPHPADTEAAAPANPNPFQRRHSQPEEDLDNLFHQ